MTNKMIIVTSTDFTSIQKDLDIDSMTTGTQQELKSSYPESTNPPSADSPDLDQPLNPKIPLDFILEEGENLTQLESLYDRFILLKKANEEDVSQINFTVFVEQLRRARTQYIAKHGWVALKFSVHYRAGRVAIKAKPVKL